MGRIPFILTWPVARCPAIFPGVWPYFGTFCPQVGAVGRRTGAFIYTLPADKASPAFVASLHTITELFSCQFKSLPLPQRHFHGNTDKAYHIPCFASKVMCQGQIPLEAPDNKTGGMLSFPRVYHRLLSTVRFTVRV